MPLSPDEGKNSWLTGTASWNFVAITQYILGVKPEYNGLAVNPSIPSAWSGFKVNRKFRGTHYNIEVKNPNNVSCGVTSLTVNGEPVDGTLIPLQAEGSTVDVVVTMG